MAATRVGRLKRDVQVSAEYARLSREDEQAALELARAGLHRHACYFLIQSIEKAVRAEIFRLVNPNLEYFRERSRTHSVDEAVEFLLEILPQDAATKARLERQLADDVLKGLRFHHLHNDLRYPAYSRRFESYSGLSISKRDVEVLKICLSNMRSFLKTLTR